MARNDCVGLEDNTDGMRLPGLRLRRIERLQADRRCIVGDSNYLIDNLKITKFIKTF